MTRNNFLNALRDFTDDAVKDMLLPVKPSKEDPKPEKRPAHTYRMMLPNMNSTDTKAPYIIQQIVTGADEMDDRSLDMSTVHIRTIFCVYCGDDKEEGGMALNELIDRYRIALLKTRVIENRYILVLKGDDKLEEVYYTEDTSPFYMAEMVSTWRLPAIQREVDYGYY